MRGLSHRVGHLIVIIKEEKKLVIVAIGKLERSNYGFMIKDYINESVHYFPSRFLKTRWKEHDYKLFPRNVLTLKQGCDTTKPPGNDGFEKRIRIKQLPKLK